jgi:hypothetical protein
MALYVDSFTFYFIIILIGLFSKTEFFIVIVEAPHVCNPTRYVISASTKSRISIIKLYAAFLLTIKITNSVAFSPQTNPTDSATATCRRNLVPTFVDRGVSRGQRGGIPTAVNLSFLHRSSHCCSENMVAPENESGASGSAAMNSDH